MHLLIFNVRLYLPIFSVIFSIIMIGYCLFKGRKTKLLYSYILLLTIIVIYSAAWEWGELAWLDRNLQSTRLAQEIVNLVAGYIGYSWLLFFGLYTKSRLISKKRNLWLLLIPPSVLFVSLLTNDYHHLFFTPSLYSYNNTGILFWFDLAVIYIYLSIGIIMMIKYAFNQMRVSRGQSILLIFSAFIPLLGNFMEELEFVMGKGSTPFTQFSLSLSVLLFGVVSFKYRFLDIIPVAWQKIMNHMKESMLIIDRANTVVNYNHSFEYNFPEFIRTGTDDLNIFTEQLSNHCEELGENNQVITAIKRGATGALSGELILVTPEWKCFSVYIQSILSKRGEIQGRIVLFNDITNDKKLLKKLHDKNTIMSAMNQELAAANEQLKDYARTVEELAVAQERNRISRDIHDSVGHNMTLLITLLELTTDLYDQNTPETRGKLVEATGVARESLQELRRSIRHQTRIGDLLDSLDRLIENFKAAGIQINFSAQGINAPLQPQYSEVIYRICQEALTNAVRHGNAKQATIVLRLKGQIITLKISDNGQGSPIITKGMGLSGMEQRVEELNGTIEYGANSEGGFNIHAEIPVS